MVRRGPLVGIAAAMMLAGLAPTAHAGTERANVSSSEAEADASSVRSVLSGNGQFVVFESAASNLVAGDTNGATDIFVRDLAAGTTERVNVTTGGAQATSGFSGIPDISADGRYVVFQSAAPNLDAGDDSITDIFLYDRQTDTLDQITSPPDLFAQGSFQPSVSDDGRFVSYDTLDGDGSDPDSDIYVYDRNTDSAEQIGAGNGSSDDSHLSADGTYVAFTSFSSDLVAGDTGGDHDVFVVDRNDFADTGDETIERASLKDDESEPVGLGSNLVSPIPSSDGRYVAFTSRYTDLFADDDSDANSIEVAVRDLQNDTTERIDVASDETPSDGPGGFAEGLDVDMSADGRYVSFVARSTNLVPGDAPGSQDAFLRDRTEGTTTRMSISSEGEAGNASSHNATVSNNGASVAFESDATNLVLGDANAVTDTFVRTPILPGGATVTIRKDAQPNNAQDFAFTSTGGGIPSFSIDDDPGDSALLNQRTFDISAAQLGAKTVTESATDGWSLSNISCAGDDNSSTAGSTATLDIDAGEQILCIYTNAKDPAADLTVSTLSISDKTEGESFQIQPSFGNGGPDAAQNVTWTIDGTNVTVENFSGVSGCSQPNASDITCNIGTQSLGGQELTINYTAGAAGPASITSTVSTTTDDPNPGGESSTAAFTVIGDDPPDTDPPQTTIEGPKKTKQRKPTFTFTADEESTFECSLDGKPFSDCESPYKTKKLKPGKHTLEVQATDEAGNTEDPPAEHRFKVQK